MKYRILLSLSIFASIYTDLPAQGFQNRFDLPESWKSTGLEEDPDNYSYRMFVKNGLQNGQLTVNSDGYWHAYADLPPDCPFPAPDSQVIKRIPIDGFQFAESYKVGADSVGLRIKRYPGDCALPVQTIFDHKYALPAEGPFFQGGIWFDVGRKHLFFSGSVQLAPANPNTVYTWFITKIDLSNGQVIWSRQESGWAFLNSIPGILTGLGLKSGGCAALLVDPAQPITTYLLHIDETGKKSFQTLVTTKYSEFNPLRETSSGDILLSFWTSVHSMSEPAKMMVVKPNGTLLFQNTIPEMLGQIFNTSLPNNRIHVAFQTKDGGYIVALHNNIFYTGEHFLRLDTAGKLLWHKYYPDLSVQFTHGIETSDGGYLFGGEIYNGELAEEFLMKIDGKGEAGPVLQACEILMEHPEFEVVCSGIVSAQTDNFLAVTRGPYTSTAYFFDKGLITGERKPPSATEARYTFAVENGKLKKFSQGKLTDSRTLPAWLLDEYLFTDIAAYENPSTKEYILGLIRKDSASIDLVYTKSNLSLFFRVALPEDPKAGNTPLTATAGDADGVFIGVGDKSGNTHFYKAGANGILFDFPIEGRAVGIERSPCVGGGGYNIFAQNHPDSTNFQYRYRYEIKAGASGVNRVSQLKTSVKYGLWESNSKRELQRFKPDSTYVFWKWSHMEPPSVDTVIYIHIGKKRILPSGKEKTVWEKLLPLWVFGFPEAIMEQTDTSIAAFGFHLQSANLWAFSSACYPGLVPVKTPAEEASKWILYPNPATNGPTYISPLMEIAGEVNLELVDVLGRLQRRDSLVHPKPDQPFILNTGDLPPGVYFVKIRAGMGHLETLPLIVK